MSADQIAIILTAIARVEERVEAIRDDNNKADAIHQDHESRLRGLEKIRWVVLGIGLAVGGSAGAVVERVVS